MKKNDEEKRINVSKKELLGIAILGLLTVNATAGTFGVELGRQQTKLESDFSFITEKDLGFDDSVNTFKPTLFFQEDRLRVDIDYEKLEFNGKNTLTQDIRFNQIKYYQGTDITSKLKFRWFRAGVKYKVADYDKSYLNLGLNLNSLSADTQLLTSTIYNYVKVKSIFFSYGIDGNYAFTNRFGIESKAVGGFVFKDENNSLGQGELYIGLNMYLFNNAKLKAGYQYKALGIDIDSFHADFKFKGAFVGLEYSF